jgi:RNA polymerase sigma-70 factor (ECF subfamily)
MVMREDPRSDEVLLACTAGDPEAFAVFYRRHLRAVLAYLLRRTRRSDLATDLAAETFAAALESAPRFTAEGSGAARGWLFTIAAHKLADAARRKRVADEARRRLGMAPLVVDDELGRAEELHDARALSATLEGLVADLPVPQRRAVLARIVNERSYADIAAELECSPALVRKNVSRSLGSLRRRLEEGAR